MPGTLEVDIVSASAGAVSAGLFAAVWTWLTRPSRSLRAFQAEAQVSKNAGDMAFRAEMRADLVALTKQVELLQIEVARLGVMWSVMPQGERDETTRLIRHNMRKARVEEGNG